MRLDRIEDTAICGYVALIQGGVSAAWISLLMAGLVLRIAGGAC